MPHPPTPPLDPELVRAYWQTRYCVYPPGEASWHLHPGQQHPAFDRWLTQTFAQACWCVITAWNPYSAPQSDTVNAAANARLQGQLEAAGYLCLPAQGEAESGDWPPEKSLWVAGLTEAEACRWGRQHRQHAVLWGQAGEAARLVACATGALLPFPAVPDVGAPPRHTPPRPA